MKFQTIILFICLFCSIYLTEEIVNVKDIKLRRQQVFYEYGEQHFDRINTYIHEINDAILRKRMDKMDLWIPKDLVPQMLMKCFEAGHTSTFVISTGRLFVVSGGATIMVRDVPEESTCEKTTCDESHFDPNAMNIASLKHYVMNHFPPLNCYTMQVPCSNVWVFKSLDDFFEHGPFERIYGN